MSFSARSSRFTSELEISRKDADILRAKAGGQSDSIRIQAEGEAQALLLKSKAQAEDQAEITKTLTRDYLLYKAFESNSTRYYFLPTGKDGLPIIINPDATVSR
ncbi:MAG: hypothetical protein HY717_05945 [Planctomycetes bacterium]|nr:hypothetical protein [Planctomycetota bacterium]